MDEQTAKETSHRCSAQPLKNLREKTKGLHFLFMVKKLTAWEKQVEDSK
jgi:hypothetical protein